ncbi:MAG TPA: aryl-sulfate sulfohydrolase, partial [Verrucomicrobiales bacterium]|nr:aryl-sulfate sulfohydrolase [Verrucomicrobiales bacterium]
MHLVRSLLFAGALFTASSVSGADRPNIIFILADDLGWTDLGCQGSTYYETPHIDRLARGGLRFDAFYMSQNCAPTRACLMSGQYAPRTGLYTVSTLERGKAEDRRMHVPKNETLLTLKVKTVADVLKSAGYATGMFGKWHLGHEQGFHPADRGFDEALRSNGRHFKIRTDPPTDVPEDQYFADWLTERGVDFIARHRDESFFLYLPHFAVHSPYQAKDEYVKRWESEPGVGGHNNPVYAAMIQSVDGSVGAVMAALERHGIADNTLVIFSSD